MKNTFILLFLCIAFTSCNKSESKTHDEILVETLIKTSSSWNDSSLIAYPTGQPEITILKIDIPPHTSLDLHQHPVINAGVLTKGQLKVIAEDRTETVLNEGDAIVELVNTTHYGKNESDEIAQIIVFYAGIKDQPITVYTDKHK